MSVIAVKIKIMPESPATDLKKLEADISKLFSKEGAKNPGFTIEPIAFGLKALILTFGWPEDKELDLLENSLGKIPGTASVQIIDIRRAFG